MDWFLSLSTREMSVLGLGGSGGRGLKVNEQQRNKGVQITIEEHPGEWCVRVEFPTGRMERNMSETEVQAVAYAWGVHDGLKFADVHPVWWPKKVLLRKADEEGSGGG